jgi:hypothetical protein
MLIVHAEDASFDYRVVETGLCLWEAAVDLMTAGFTKEKAGEDPGDTYRKYQAFHDGVGSFTMRAAVFSLSDECNTAWQVHVDLCGDNEPMCFDFEFCPAFLVGTLDSGLMEQAVDWQHRSPDEIKLELLKAA